MKIRVSLHDFLHVNRQGDFLISQCPGGTQYLIFTQTESSTPKYQNYEKSILYLAA